MMMLTQCTVSWISVNNLLGQNILTVKKKLLLNINWHPVDMWLNIYWWLVECQQTDYQNKVWPEKLLIQYIWTKSFTVSYFHLSPNNVFNFLCSRCRYWMFPLGKIKLLSFLNLLLLPHLLLLPSWWEWTIMLQSLRTGRGGRAGVVDWKAGR